MKRTPKARALRSRARVGHDLSVVKYHTSVFLANSRVAVPFLLSSGVRAIIHSDLVVSLNRELIKLFLRLRHIETNAGIVQSQIPTSTYFIGWPRASPRLLTPPPHPASLLAPLQSSWKLSKMLFNKAARAVENKGEIEG